MNDRSRLRLVVLRVLVLSLVATLFGRLWYLQVLAGNTFASAARHNQIRQIVTPAPRGWILDAEGRPLVRNTIDLVVSVSRTKLEAQPDHGAAVLARLAATIHQPVAKISRDITPCGPRVPAPCYNGSPYQPVPIAAYSSSDPAAARTALSILEQTGAYNGVSVQEQAVRAYPYGSLAGHELGYLGRISQQQLAQPQYAGYQPTALVGVTGLEYQYEKYLRGTPGVKNVTVDSGGNVTGTASSTPPVPGDYLVLNLDAGVQEALTQALEDGIHRAQALGAGYLASSAAGVVMNVRTGAVVAMASVPNFDPSQFTGGIPTAAYQQLNSAAAGIPLISRAYQGAFPPGSTFKVISTSAILSHGLAGYNTLTPCPQILQIGNFAAHNFQYESAPPLTLAGAIRISCDTVFYKYGYDQWIADGGLRNTPATRAKPAQQIFVKMARSYGLGGPTGVDLPGETPGLIGGREYHKKYWQANKAQECAGAHAHPTDPLREQLDAYNCQYGYLLQGGQAADFVIGQGSDVLLSPLQLADVYATVANGGTVLAPRLAKAVMTPSGQVVKTFGPAVRGHVPVSASDLAYIRGALKDVVTGGTGAGVFNPVLDVGGKTGTADNALPGQPISWFASVQPIDNPRYVCVIMVNHAGQGAQTSAPSVAEVYNKLYGLGTPAIVPGGVVPAALPRVNVDGSLVSPVAHPAPVAAQPPMPGGAPAPASGVVAVLPTGWLATRRRRRRTGPGRRRCKRF